MSEQERNTYEQSPVWKKLGDLELKLTSLNAKVENLPLAIRISLEKSFITDKDVSIILTKQCEHCDEKYLKISDAKSKWEEYQEKYVIKNVEKTSRLVKIIKGVGWVLTSVATGILTLIIWVEKFLN